MVSALAILFVPTASSCKYKSLVPAPPAGSMADGSNVLARLGVTLETYEAGKCIINGHSVRTITSHETGATVVSIIDVIAAVNHVSTSYASKLYGRTVETSPEVRGYTEVHTAFFADPDTNSYHRLRRRL